MNRFQKLNSFQLLLSPFIPFHFTHPLSPLEFSLDKEKKSYNFHLYFAKMSQKKKKQNLYRLKFNVSNRIKCDFSVNFCLFSMMRHSLKICQMDFCREKKIAFCVKMCTFSIVTAFFCCEFLTKLLMFYNETGTER